MSTLSAIKLALTKPEALILVMNDFQAKQVLVAWTLYGSEFKETPAVKGEDDRATLVRWWASVEPNLSRLAMIAGLPVTRVTKIFYRLCAAFLVWPDGTIAADAMNVIRGERNAYVRALIPRPQSDALSTDKGKLNDGKRTGKEDAKTDRRNRSAPAHAQTNRRSRRRA